VKNKSPWNPTFQENSNIKGGSRHRADISPHSKNALENHYKKPSIKKKKKKIHASILTLKANFQTGWWLLCMAHS
jgi:hypothetical protein